ncbi:MAG: hypothetical protein AB8G11_12380 [Saprospiraceae bacterium]
MKTLSLVPMVALGSLITFLAVFAPVKNAMNSSAEVEMTEVMKKKKFKEFINNFDNVDLPYDINQADFQDYMTDRKGRSTLYNNNRRIDSEFKTFVPGLGARFSRMGPNIYLYEAVLASSNDAATVIYSSHAPYRDYPAYLMVTYDASGDIINETTFAHRSYDELIVGKINKEMHVTIKKYTFDYEDEDISYEKVIDESKLNLKNVATSKVTIKGKVESTSTASVQEITTENRAK